MIRTCVPAAALATVLAAPAPAQAPAESLPRIAPEEAGFSADGLARIGAVRDRDIADGKLPGAAPAIARDGKRVLLHACGYRDKAAGVPMTTGAIFSIASMTKPMTAVATLALVEQMQPALMRP